MFSPAPRADAPCYRCLYPEPPPPGHGAALRRGRVLGVLCARIGSIQVTEAIKLLTGWATRSCELMIYDALEMEYRKLRSARTRTARSAARTPTVTGLIDYDTFCGAVSEEAPRPRPGRPSP